VDEELHGNRRCSGTPSVAELKKEKKKRQFVAAAFSFSRFFTGGVPPHLYVQVCFQIHVRSAPRFVSEKEGQPERRPLSRKKKPQNFRSALSIESLELADGAVRTRRFATRQARRLLHTRNKYAEGSDAVPYW